MGNHYDINHYDHFNSRSDDHIFEWIGVKPSDDDFTHFIASS
jgi:hypothetical protein